MEGGTEVFRNRGESTATYWGGGGGIHFMEARETDGNEEKRRESQKHEGRQTRAEERGGKEVSPCGGK